MQGVAVCHSVLHVCGRYNCVAVYCVVVCCRVLQRVIVCCSVCKWAGHPRSGLCVTSMPDATTYDCCSVLQCVAVCCSLLQSVAVCCSVLQCVAVEDECTSTLNEASHFNTLQHITTHCNILQHSGQARTSRPFNATYCNTLQHTATCGNTLVEHAGRSLSRNTLTLPNSG